MSRKTHVEEVTLTEADRESVARYARVMYASQNMTKPAALGVLLGAIVAAKQARLSLAQVVTVVHEEWKRT
jgi:hypothetical protein